MFVLCSLDSVITNRGNLRGRTPPPPAEHVKVSELGRASISLIENLFILVVANQNVPTWPQLSHQPTIRPTNRPSRALSAN